MIEDEVRPGWIGHWDRFAGPSASRTDSTVTFAVAVAGAVWGGKGLGDRATVGRALLMRAMAIDLWGGACVNNTRSCVRWYERPGQGFGEHMAFAAAHVLHPAVIVAVDHNAGTRSGMSAARWTLTHYGWMVVSAALITRAHRRSRLPVALAASAAGVLLDRVLEPSAAARWFAPIYYSKLLIGHAAGSIWNSGENPVT